jgi:hypothetical protein
MFSKFLRRLALATSIGLFLVGGFPSVSEGDECGPLQIDIYCGHECRYSCGGCGGNCVWNQEIPLTAACIKTPEGHDCGYSNPQWYCQCLNGGGGGF